jgi:hypothetical protein
MTEGSSPCLSPITFEDLVVAACTRWPPRRYGTHLYLGMTEITTGGFSAAMRPFSSGVLVRLRLKPVALPLLACGRPSLKAATRMNLPPMPVEYMREPR